MREPIITVRDWRRRPPLRLRLTKKLDIHWCWIKCTRCPHMRAVAIAPYMIRWGPDGWRDMLRRAGRCTKCGTRGVELQHPSWGGSDTGWAPISVNRMAFQSVDVTPERHADRVVAEMLRELAKKRAKLRPAIAVALAQSRDSKPRAQARMASRG